ncbi:MAG TPA: hypothetical protein VJQ53_04095, partial [Candidatus Eisenbacteria bacterium]|nr:hypothetical protein [Candidatus Eisenbacteria bacterium]
RRLMRTLRFVRFSQAPAIFAAMILSGCGSDSPTKPKPSPPAYSVRSSPAEVLSNLEIAYSRRDSTETKALYDSSYVGTSRDLGDPPGTIPLNFTYTDEVAHVATLARTSTITSAYVNLGPPTSWTRLASNDLSHPEWATIQIAGPSLTIRVVEGSTEYAAGGTREFLEFLFKPSTPESASPTDTLWTIVRWNETKAYP